jgi:hypothetical protein
MVLVETIEFQEAISADHKRLLMGILRGIGVTNFFNPAVLYLENSNQLQPLLNQTGRLKTQILYFGSALNLDDLGVKDADLNAIENHLFFSEGLQQIMESADAKKTLWSKLKRWKISGSNSR